MDPEIPPAVSQLLASDPERFSRDLTHKEGLFLLYGDDGGDDCPFQNELEAAAVWFVHRTLLMASYRNTGKRPAAWHVLEGASLPWKGYNRERSTLWEAGPGVLEEQERAELEAMWRKEFDAAQQLDPDARQKAYAAADIPKSLLRTWQRELRRRQKTARRVTAGAPVSKSTPQATEVAAPPSDAA